MNQTVERENFNHPDHDDNLDQPTFSKKKGIVLAISAATVLALSAGVFAMNPQWLMALGIDMGTSSGSSSSSAAGGATTTAAAEDRVVANVNGVNINESEIMPIMATGVDRAVAIDRYVNKVLAAQLAEREYAKDADVALRAAQREVLSTLYMQKRTQSISTSITDQEIKSYYDKNVREEDYKQFKLRYYLTQDVGDGEATAKAIVNKEKDALSKLKYMKEGTDNFLIANEIPYGLGRLVKDLKEGETSRPIVLRNGVFVLNLEQVKEQPKPTLDRVKNEIRNILVAEKIGTELTEKRKIASIQLK